MRGMKQEVKDMQEKYRAFTVKLHDYSNEELVELFQKTQAEECLVELMQKNKGIIYTIASSYKISGYDLDDLMQIGYEALWKTANHYDPSRGCAFTTCLKGFLHRELTRLYNEAKRLKRGKGVEPVSYEELAEINRERFSEDDYSGLYLDEFLSTLSDTTHKVASLILEGLTNGEIAKALGIAPSSVNYHYKRIKAAYLTYCVEG